MAETKAQQIAEFLDRNGITGTVRETHADALSQSIAQFESIAEMVEAVKTAQETEDGQEDNARERIQEDALSIQVRSGWYNPGSRDADRAPAEFEILLCTGGPAVRIIGELSEHGEPEKARLQYQGWFIPWTDTPWHLLPGKSDAEETLLSYAQEFYFGEGE